MENYDVAIIGAGPAGAVLAQRLGLKRKVVLVDARPMQAPARISESLCAGPHYLEKCCGGLLAPDARKWLSNRGLFLPASVLDGVQPDNLRALDLTGSLERLYPTEYINLSRSSFEKWLLSLVPRGVETFYGYRLKKIEREKTGFKLRLSSGNNASGSVIELRCRFLVGADGANSMVRRFLNRPARSQAAYLAVQDVFPAESADAISGAGLFEEYVAFFQPMLTDFYGWIIPKSDQIILGMAMPAWVREAKKATVHMELLKKMLRPAGYDFSGSFRRSGCLLLRPHLSDVFLGDDSVFLIGEAAGFISPSSAEGYSYAFISADNLANAILRHEHGAKVRRAYAVACLKMRANILYKLSKSLIMFSPSIRQMIMYSGLFAKV